MTMRRIAPYALLVLVAAPAAAQPGPAPGALFAQENAVWQAVAEHRPQAFAAFLDRDYVGVYGDGFHDAAAEVTAVSQITLARFQISDFVARNVDSNNVVVTYRIDLSGNAGGQEFSGRYTCSSLWHRSGRQWHVALHSEARIGN